MGVVFRDKKDFDKAEEMYLKALEIDKKLGSCEGLAIRYDNLGSIYEKRKDYNKDRECWSLAIEYFSKMGVPQKVKEIQEEIDKI
ncbi:MAG: tetratricopeptide repeat protein [Planctomycetaceae bacterium]|nr:tetratricopeptide repeat protein [Planctomycetaceae bacterium]